MTEDHRLTLTEAAQALGWKYFKSRDALLAGLLRGGRDADGRFWVETASVNEVLAERATAPRSPGAASVQRVKRAETPSDWGPTPARASEA